MVNNLKKWQDEPDIKGERCLTLANCRPRTADYNPESQLLKANRSKMAPEA